VKDYRRGAEGAEKCDGGSVAWLTLWQAGARQAAPLPGIVEIAVAIGGGPAERDRRYKCNCDCKSTAKSGCATKFKGVHPATRGMTGIESEPFSGR
jgi:hypothetical protein